MPPTSLTLHDALPAALFFGAAGLVLGSAALVAFSKNVIRATVALLFSVLGLGSLYLQLAAGLVSAVVMLVYVMATALFVAFAVRAPLKIASPETSNPREAGASGLAAAAVLALLVGKISWSSAWPLGAAPRSEAAGAVATTLMRTHGVAFGLSAVALVSAAVCARVVLARATKSGSLPPGPP